MSWMCDCNDDADAAENADEAGDTRASWKRASWGRASWKAFFGESPADYGELSGGRSGEVKRPSDDPRAPQGQAGSPAKPAGSS